MVMLYKAKDIEKLKSQHQKELKWEDRLNQKLQEENQKLKKELSECREDNIKLTKEIQEQDKELSDIRLRILDRLGFDITDLKEKRCIK